MLTETMLGCPGVPLADWRLSEGSSSAWTISKGLESCRQSLTFPGSGRHTVSRALFRKRENSLRAEFKGTNYMGQTGFCENLQFPAIFCENLRFPAVFCENLRLRNAVIPRKSKNQQKSAKICKKLRIRLCLSHLVSPFYNSYFLVNFFWSPSPTK